MAAGLGDPPSEFCTNDSEAINSALKQFLGFKKSDWPVFLTTKSESLSKIKKKRYAKQ